MVSLFPLPLSYCIPLVHKIIPKYEIKICVKSIVPFPQNVARHQLYLEFLRSAIVGLLEAPEKSMEVILWTGFLFLKVS